MERRSFVKVLGLSAFAVSSTGFTLIEKDKHFSTDCATSQDMLGPFYRKGAPLRNMLVKTAMKDEIPLLVKGKVYGADCSTPLSHVEIDIWHCDEKKDYDMTSDSFKCRGKIFSNEQGEYWFKTFVPPPYGGRPKHIHYLIQHNSYESLATQLYFKGDKKIKPNNWVKFKWDERRILEIYKNEEGISEVSLDLHLTPKI